MYGGFAITDFPMYPQSRINLDIANPHLPMDMRPGAYSGVSYFSDYPAFGNILTCSYEESRHVKYL